jgi:hypothetical protein
MPWFLQQRADEVIERSAAISSRCSAVRRRGRSQISLKPCALALRRHKVSDFRIHFDSANTWEIYCGAGAAALQWIFSYCGLTATGRPEFGRHHDVRSCPR